MKRLCGRCHTCGAPLRRVLDGEEWCPTCGAYRRYASHGWAASVAEPHSGQCPTFELEDPHADGSPPDTEEEGVMEQLDALKGAALWAARYNRTATVVYDDGDGQWDWVPGRHAGIRVSPEALGEFVSPQRDESGDVCCYLVGEDRMSPDAIAEELVAAYRDELLGLLAEEDED